MPFVARDGRPRAAPDERARRATRRSCSPTGRSRGSSAATAPRPRCACTPRGRSRPASRCCCASCRATGDDRATRRASVVAHNPCLSGGAIEIFLEPQLPRRASSSSATTPIARALDALGRAAGYDVVRGDPSELDPQASDAAVVVASHGNDEEPVLARALARGRRLRGARRQREARRGRVGTRSTCRRAASTAARARRARRSGRGRRPRSRSSILAELVPSRARSRRRRPEPRGRPAIDPVCGMEVAVVGRDAARSTSAATPCTSAARVPRGLRGRPQRCRRALTPRHRPRARGGRVAAARAAQAAAAVRRRARCSTHALGDAARLRVRAARSCALGGGAEAIREHGRPERRRGRREPELGAGRMLVVDRRGPRRGRPAHRRARAAARRPAGRDAGDRAGPARGARRRADRGVPLRRRASAIRSRSRRSIFARPGSAARRQGRVEAARPAGGRRRRRAGRRRRSRSTSTPGTTTGGARAGCSAAGRRPGRGAEAVRAARPRRRGARRAGWPSRLPGRRRARDGAVPRRAPAAAAAARGRGRRRQDRGGQGARRALGTPLFRLQCYEGIDAARGALRVELPAPAARASGSPRRPGRALAEDDLFTARVPDPPPAARRRSSTRGRCRRCC